MSSVSIEILLGGRVVPATRWEPAQPGSSESFDGGVHYDNGDVCQIGRIVKPWSIQKSALISDKSFSTVPGRHIFAGMLQNEHFGHFISENLSRLWILGHLDPADRSVVFYLRRPGVKIAKFVFDMFQIIDPTIRLHIVTSPEQFEILTVPQDLNRRGFTVSHPLLEPIRKKLQSIVVGAEKKIYVSRSRLSRYEGGILGDKLIDAYMEQEGYRVIFPETMSISEQISAYSGAEKIVFAEGSALHLYALICNAKQDIFVIWRRRKNAVFAWQISTFGGPPLRGEPCIQNLWVPENEISDPAHGKAMLSFDSLSRQLHANGFIQSSPWNDPPDNDLRAELDAISAQRKRKYVLISEQTT